MTNRNPTPNTAHQRALIASAAARLIAESGVTDYNLAKRKAAHGLGLAENAQLPENAEVEEAVRTHLRLFQDREQTERIEHHRQKACEIMTILQQFTPYLTGSVLDGTAGRYAEIDIQLFTDSAKEVEIFLLNQRLDFEHSTPRSPRAEAVLSLYSENAITNLIVYPAREERVAFKTRDGKTRPRARLETVRGLLSAARDRLP